jgi:hypothetical protein
MVLEKIDGPQPTEVPKKCQIYQIFEAFLDIGSKHGVVHMDLTDENILWSGKESRKIGNLDCPNIKFIDLDSIIEMNLGLEETFFSFVDGQVKEYRHAWVPEEDEADEKFMGLMRELISGYGVNIQNYQGENPFMLRVKM